MLTTLIEKPFNDKEWLFEIKWDGFRAVAELNCTQVKLYSRNFQSFNARFADIVSHLKKLDLDAIFDGEIVALDKKGRSHFQFLQNASSKYGIYYYVFDLLYLNGQNLTNLPLIERKKRLKRLLTTTGVIRYLHHVDEKGVAFFTLCEKKGFEGIVGKNRNSPYLAGKRTKNWVKIKTHLRQEVVICGFTEPRGGRGHFGALITGVYKNRELIFTGLVGGGFSEESLKRVKKVLTPHIQKKSPFTHPPKTKEKATWVKPKFLAEVKFAEWTQDHIMRQPIFLGLRSDKAAKSVRIEKP